MIYLFDKDEKLFKIINKPALKTVLQKYALTTEQYVSDRLTVEMKSIDTDELEKVEYMAIPTIEDAHTFHYFYVAQKYTDQLTTLIGVQSGIEELRKTPVLDKRPKNAFAEKVINDLLKDTNWQARFVGETIQRSTNFYYVSVFEALKKVCKVWDLEMQFFVEMNGNKIGARYIDFKRKIGSAVGKRVVYGHNALQILQEVERTNLFTALIGRGKGEQVSSAEESEKKTDGYGRKITFENVIWDIKKGNPVNKPKGQRFVELPEMTKIYGIKNTDGSIRPKIGFIDFQEEEDPGVLLERTYKALVDTARPQLTLKTTSAYLRGVKVGDTIRVVRHDKKLDYDTRIFEITFNRLNNESSDIKLGDRIGESNEAKAQSIAEKVVDDFVSNEFSNLVQNLPDFLPSPDGFNNNWYGAEDPTVKHPGKVLVNDIWFKPDPEHEGHKIMLRWTGEVWDEILRSYDKESLKKRISEEIANFDKAFQLENEKNKKKIDEIQQSSGASASLAEEAKRISEQAKDGIEKAKELFLDGFKANLSEIDGLSDRLKKFNLDHAEFRKSTKEDIKGLTESFTKLGSDTKSDILATRTEFQKTAEGFTQRFESITSQLDNKANLLDFQRVQETSKLYERIIGSSESDIAEKVARMALTNQLFQVEVGKYANAGGPNMLRNSRADDGLKHWTEANGRLGFTAHGYYFNGQKRMFELRPGAVVKSPRFIIKRNTDYTLNILGFDNNSKYFMVYVCKRVKGSGSDYQQRLLIFNGQPKWVNGPVFDASKAVKKSITFNVGEFDECYLQFEYDKNNPNKWGGLFMTELDFYEGTNDRLWQPAPEDATLETDKTLEATQTKMTQLAGSWAVQNLTSAGAIISQINATNNQILIEAEKIRLKGKTLLDELTAIDGYFKRLFVGEGTFATLNTDILRANSITADKLVMDQAMARRFVSSDIFTDTLAAKEAFISKLRSVIVSATLLEGYKGFIGGFQLGTHEKDASVYWLTGRDQFSVGMSNGYGKWSQTALWVNWGEDWNAPGSLAWFVKRSGEMYCYNRAYFWNTPIIYGNLKVTGNIFYKNENSGKSGYWISSPKYSSIDPNGGHLYLYYSGGGYDWIPMNKDVSDRRYKHNIEASTVSGLDVIEKLKTYSYRKEYDGKIEDISCGIMAQDVQKYVPEAFYENPDGAYSYRTFELVPYLIKAIQELNHKIEKLEKTA